MTAQELLIKALAEDAPSGDLTCLSLSQLKSNIREKALAYIVAKEDLVFSGAQFLNAVKDLHKHSQVSAPIEVDVFFADGQVLHKGQKLVSFYGSSMDLLLVERSLLNIISRLSGIATLTQKFVQQVEHTSTKILDTRKTTPLYRHFEKQAVKDGGGQNHRMNLSTAIMLKENHLQATPLPPAEIIASLRQNHPSAKIIIEVKNFAELQGIIDSPVDQVLLDNMSLEEIKECLSIIPSHIKSEASGNMTLQRVKQVAETGVDYISVGQITHSVASADMSFLLD